MNQCIKCGRQIPEGELFCLECSLNPGSSLFEEPRPAPTGRMQAPKPRTAAPAVSVAVKERDKKKNTGLKAALALVSILLALVVGFLAWQYGDIKVERTRLETKEADLLLREKEKEELELQIGELNVQLEDLNKAVEEKEQEIKTLRAQLTGSQSSQSQSQYDLSTTQAELTRLEEENKQLLLLEEELEGQIKGLTAALEATKEFAEKAEFLDSYVVFVENDDSRVYHTYDCARFSKKNFWAYSRKLAEASGFGPCSTCGGKAE